MPIQLILLYYIDRRLHFISHYMVNLRLFKYIKTKITIADIKYGSLCLDHPKNFICHRHRHCCKKCKIYEWNLFSSYQSQFPLVIHIFNDSDCGGMISCGDLQLQICSVLHKLMTVLQFHEKWPTHTHKIYWNTNTQYKIKIINHSHWYDKVWGKGAREQKQKQNITGMISLKLEMSKYTTDTFGKKN